MRFLLFFTLLCICGAKTYCRTLRPGSDNAELNAEGGGHRHEEIFLPLSVDGDGTVEGLLIDDTEAEKGPLVIEEIVDANGKITDVIIERASDLSLENIAKHRGRNRKLGAIEETQPTLDPSDSKQKTKTRARTLLPMLVLLVTVAFSVGFVLSVFLIDRLPTSFGGVLMTRKQRLGLDKKLSMKPADWKDNKDLYSPVKSPRRSPTHRSGKGTLAHVPENGSL